MDPNAVIDILASRIALLEKELAVLQVRNEMLASQVETPDKEEPELREG